MPTARARKPQKSSKNKAKIASSRAAKAPATSGLSVKTSEFGLDAVLGAAYLMMDRAYVALSGDPKKTLLVSLTPKDGRALAALQADFRAELATQKVRWAIARANLPVREHVAELAVQMANGSLAAPAAAPEEAPADQLTEDQRKEIEKLIAEVEDEIKTMNAKKSPAAADPKNIKASWEEKQESPAREGNA